MMFDPHLSILIARQHGRCAYCELPMEDRGRYRATVDHIQSRSRGGSQDIENKVAACAWCNGLKGSMSGPKWAEFFPQVRQFRNMAPAQCRDKIKTIRRKLNLTPRDNGTKPKRSLHCVIA